LTERRPLLKIEKRPVEKQYCDTMATSVTRLGDFSHIGRLFPLGIYLKIREVAHIFWATFSTVKFTH
jgi:hypothetical protein